MNISEASLATGISAKMLRYYESIGLLPAAPRSTGGYRQYSKADLHVLRFIRRARNLGFALEEIRQLLTLWQDRGRASSEVKAITLAHIADLNQRIEELVGMRDTLQNLANHCCGDHRPDCPILQDMAQAPLPERPEPTPVAA